MPLNVAGNTFHRKASCCSHVSWLREHRYFRRLQKRFSSPADPQHGKASRPTAATEEHEQDVTSSTSATDPSRSFPVVCVNLLRADPSKANDLLLSENFAKVGGRHGRGGGERGEGGGSHRLLPLVILMLASSDFTTQLPHTIIFGIRTFSRAF